MRVWRVSNHGDLSGEGGRLVAGRWHDRGLPAVYLAEHPALALLETIVHLEVDPEDVPRNYRLLSVEIADDVAIHAFSQEELDRNSPSWRVDPIVTRTLARPWFEGKLTALFRVPSVVVPHAANFVLNPLHSDSTKISIASDELVEFDARLLTGR